MALIQCNDSKWLKQLSSGLDISTWFQLFENRYWLNQNADVSKFFAFFRESDVVPNPMHGHNFEIIWKTWAALFEEFSSEFSLFESRFCSINMIQKQHKDRPSARNYRQLETNIRFCIVKILMKSNFSKKKNLNFYYVYSRIVKM